MHRMNCFLIWLLLFFISPVLICTTGCRKIVGVDPPPNRITSAQVFSNDSTATQALIGIYNQIMETFGILNGNGTLLCGEYADELVPTPVTDKDEPFFTDELTSKDDQVGGIWKNVYQYIYSCNDVIQGLENNKAVSQGLRDQLLGEARFLRALGYFYMINLFGDVPLVTVTDYTGNAKMGRTPVRDVYEQIITDLKEAQNLLPANYYTNAAYPYQRIRANKLAATALLARVYLYKKDWAAAETAATQVVESPLYKLETDVQQVFLTTGKEVILQFMSVSRFNTAEGFLFVPQNGFAPAYILTDSLLAAFEPDDKRRQWIRTDTVNGVAYHSPYKYRRNDDRQPFTEYNTVLRLGEQVLIRAEARIMQNNLAGAADDLSLLRARASLAAIGPFTSQSAAMAALEHERRIELFAEWGHRWFDLNRWQPQNSSSPSFTTRADEVMSCCKHPWKPTAKLWPIPANELQLNPALIQNTGY